MEESRSAVMVSRLEEEVVIVAATDDDSRWLVNDEYSHHEKRLVMRRGVRVDRTTTIFSNVDQLRPHAIAGCNLIAISCRKSLLSLS